MVVAPRGRAHHPSTHAVSGAQPRGGWKLVWLCVQEEEKKIDLGASLETHLDLLLGVFTGKSSSSLELLHGVALREPLGHQGACGKGCPRASGLSRWPKAGQLGAAELGVLSVALPSGQQQPWRRSNGQT